MGSPSVTVRTLDLSQYVPGFPGIATGVQIPAVKGALTPTLITNQSDFLSWYTAEKKVEVGYDNAYFSALAYLKAGNILYVNRVHNTALYGGAIFKAVSSGSSNAAIGTGLSVATEPTDPPSYTFDANTITADAEETDFTCEADASSSLNEKFVYFSSPTTDYYAWFNVGDAGTDPEIAGRTAVEVTIAEDAINSAVATALASATHSLDDFTASAVSEVVSIVNVSNGLCNKPTNGNTGWATDPSITTQGAIADTSKDCFLLYAINPGAWNNDISIKIETYLSDPDTVQLEDAFIIYVYYKSTPVEEHLCSKLQTLKDSNGNNIYLETKLESSEYIRGIDSDADTIYPVAQSTALDFDKGSDGSTVTDSNMTSALADFNNPDDLYINLFMDGGWATPAYARAIVTMCEARGDCFGILSTPYSDEAASTYMTDIVNYRKYEANINSRYAAIFTPHVKIYDEANGRNLYVSPDGYVAGVISYTAVNYEPWYAPAGLRRGVIDVLDIVRRFDKGQRDILYAAGINPIRFIPGKGIAVWGQKTLYGTPSALQRINCQMLLLVIQPALKETLESYEFEFNDELTRNDIDILISDYMGEVKAKRGVYDFRVVCDTTNNTAAVIDQEKMYADLYIKPTKVAEEIILTTIITKSSVSFA
jgi:hypothetical protein